MRLGRALVVAWMLWIAWANPASADQPSDWMVGAGNEGTYLNLDFVLGAIQSSVEHRIPIYGQANMLTLRGGGVVSVPYTGGQADVDLRILNITLGMSAGGANVWRNMTFAPGEPLDRKQRRERDAAGDFNDEAFGYWEGRAGLAFLFNDYIVFNHVNAWHITAGPERSFNYTTNVVDDARYVRSDFQLFFKHEDYGAIAPVVQVLNFPLDGDWHTQYNFGFFGATRAGLTGRDDVLALQVLFHWHELFGGYDNEDVFGWAILRGPVAFLLAYRSQITLWEPE